MPPTRCILPHQTAFQLRYGFRLPFICPRQILKLTGCKKKSAHLHHGSGYGLLPDRDVDSRIPALQHAPSRTSTVPFWFLPSYRGSPQTLLDQIPGQEHAKPGFQATPGSSLLLPRVKAKDQIGCPRHSRMFHCTVFRDIRPWTFLHPVFQLCYHLIGISAVRCQQKCLYKRFPVSHSV